MDRSDNEDDEWVRSYHERLRQITVMDALDGIPPCPRLPADLDDPVALDNWTAAWNAWIAMESVQLQRPLLKEMTRETLVGIVRAEKRARNHLAGVAQQRELAEARIALNAVAARLRAADPTYEGKRALLVPILRPILKRLPPNQWVPAFEQAYSQTRVPPDGRTPAESRETRPAEVALRYIAHMASVSFSVVAPYIVAAWVITKVETNLSFGVTLAAVIGARFSFDILDSIGRTLQWRLGGRASSVNYWLRFLQHNEFPTQRHYRHDDIGNYLCRIQDDSSTNLELRLSAKEMATRLAAFWEIGMFTGMRGRSAAEAALEIHAPRATAPELGGRSGQRSTHLE